jgi:DNA-directed RNA polymerase subunit alpha
MNTQFLLKGFKRPKEILRSTEQSGKFTGRYIIEPLERGFGITVGNALRRTLLSSIPGYAITAVKFESALHEFSTIKGVVEDVPEIILNIKQVALVLLNDVEARIVEVDKKGPGELFARDIAVDDGIKILNPDLHLATLSPGAHLKMKFQIEVGRGYVPAEDLKDRIDEEGTVVLDAMFTPVKKVSFTVSDLRLGNRSDYNKLILEIETNGAVTAEEAVGYASKMLKEIFVRFIHFKDFDESEEAAEAEAESGTESKASKVLKTSVENLELSVRSLHCLQASEIHTIEEIARRDEDDLLKTKNFGKKSLLEISEKIAKYGLKFGMSDNDIREFVEKNAEESQE